MPRQTKTNKARDSLTKPHAPKTSAWSCKRHLKARVDEEWFGGLPASAAAPRFLWLSQSRRAIDVSLPEVRFKEGSIQMRGDPSFHKPD